jgi:hypothetical protein
MVAIDSIENITKILRNFRTNFLNPKPYAIDLHKLSLNLIVTHRNQEFYQYGPERYNGLEEKTDFLIFYLEFAINKLKKIISGLWMKHFQQFHLLIGSLIQFLFWWIIMFFRQCSEF